MSKKKAEHEERADEAKVEDTAKATVEKEKDEVADLAEELAAQKDKYVRLMAEFDNFKKRTAAEYVKMAEVANKTIMNDLIEVGEVFQKALDPNATADGEAFKNGITLLHNKFGDVLTKHGLEAFGEVGDEFDPALHDAMMQQPSEDIAENHILTIFERGYKLKNNIIRHAKVVVSAGKA